MRILIDATPYGDLRSGLARRTFELFARVAVTTEDRHKFFLLHHPVLAGTVADRMPGVTSVPTTRTGQGVLWRMAVGNPNLKRRARELACDLIQQDVLPLARPAETLPCLHDLRYLHPELGEGLGRRLYARWRMGRQIRQCPLIVTVSRFSAREIESAWGIDSTRIRVVPNGIDPAPFRAEGPGPDMRFGLDDRPFVLYVGHREPRKNLPVLIRAVAQWQNKGLPHRLVVVGRPLSGYDEPERVVAELGLEDEVVFLSDVSETELPTFYRTADVFCLPSLYEGFGIPILEAMAACCPVVSPRGGPFGEVAGPRAVADPSVPEDWALEVSRLVTDETARSAAISAGDQQVGAYSWDAAAASMALVLDEVAARV